MEREKESNIPLSEDFEICFCLKVSEREKRERKGEKERQKDSQTDNKNQEIRKNKLIKNICITVS